MKHPKEDISIENFLRDRNYSSLSSEDMKDLELSLMASEFEKAPDTFGLMRLFLLSFPTTEMIEDFPCIEREYLSHIDGNLWNDDYDSYAEDRFEPASDTVMRWVLNRILSSALAGNSYEIELIKYLYETYYRKEYKQLRRFRKLSFSEIVALSFKNDAPVSDSFFSLARHVVMCRFYDIKTDETVRPLYRMFSNLSEEYEQDDSERSLFDGFSKEVIQEVNDFMEPLITEHDSHPGRFDKRVLAPFHDMNRFLYACLEWLDLPPDIIEKCEFEFDDDLSLFIRTAELLKSTFPERSLDFEQVQQFSLILKTASALSGYQDDTEEFLQKFLACSPDNPEPLRNNRYLFQAETFRQRLETAGRNKTPSAGKSPVSRQIPSDSSDSSSSDQELVSIIERLRHENRKLQQEKEHLEQQLRKTERKSSESSEQLRILESEHAELLKLRQYVSGLTEEEIPEQIAEEDMETFLKSKKVVIIGGHDNWTYKLRNRFRKWEFLTAEINVANDGKVLDGADYIYFFTDILSHGTYGKFIRIIREKGLPYGYIHTINVAANIRQIYQDISEEEQECKSPGDRTGCTG